MAFTGALSEAIEPVDHVQSVRSYKFVFFIFWGDWSSAEGDKSAGDWILVLYSRIVCCFLHWFLLLWFKSISSWFKTWSFFLQGGEHSRTAFASCSPSSPRLDLVSPHHNSLDPYFESWKLLFSFTAFPMSDAGHARPRSVVISAIFGLLSHVLKDYASLWWFIDLCLYSCMNSCCRAERRQEQTLLAP
jgi:hypothetical protein